MKDKLLSIFIGIVMVVATAISTYYIGNAKQDSKLADVDKRVALLEQKEQAVSIQINKLILTVEKNTKKTEKLYLLLSAKFGVVIE